MRVNLHTTPLFEAGSSKDAVPVMLTIQPSRGVAGRFDRSIDSTSLLSMLRTATDLPLQTLKVFDLEIRSRSKAKLLAVNLPDTALETLGYFID